jgi:hypothetical protein
MSNTVITCQRTSLKKMLKLLVNISSYDLHYFITYFFK